MIFVYNVPNTNPSLGPVSGNKQTVSVYDRKLGNRRTVATTPEKADQFIADRTKAMQQAGKDSRKPMALVTMTGAGIGAIANSVPEVTEAKKLNSFIKPLNEELGAMIKNGQEALSAKIKLLHDTKYEKKWYELSKMFSEETSSFKAKNIFKVAEKSAVRGALFGAAIAGALSLFIPAVKAETADNKVTQKFIDENK